MKLVIFDIDGTILDSVKADGLWDFKTTIELGIDFIGIDFNGNNKLFDS